MDHNEKKKRKNKKKKEKKTTPESSNCLPAHWFVYFVDDIGRRSAADSSTNPLVELTLFKLNEVTIIWIISSWPTLTQSYGFLSWIESFPGGHVEVLDIWAEITLGY